MLKAWLTLSTALFLSVAYAQSWEVWKYQPEGRYPEGVTYDPQDRQFYLSSLKYGTVGKLAPGAQYQVFSDDADLISSAGVQVDTLNRRLLVVVHDDGASTRSDPNTKHHLARLVVFDLDSRQKLFSQDLNTLAEGRSHGNDVTLDDQANAYVTDSFRPLIYKVTPGGIPSVFVQVDILRSTDDWQSATVVSEYQHTSFNCPTTVEVVDSEIYVANSHFKELFESPESEHDTRKFALTKIKLTQ